MMARDSQIQPTRGGNAFCGQLVGEREERGTGHFEGMRKGQAKCLSLFYFLFLAQSMQQGFEFCVMA